MKEEVKKFNKNEFNRLSFELKRVTSLLDDQKAHNRELIAKLSNSE